jgi:SAM-dependent methyltransferase
MELYPEIRKLEFQQLLDGANPSSFKKVIDLPSGGSYLEPYLPAECEIMAYDPASGFHGTKESISPISFEAMALPSSSADAVVTLAAMHHIDDRLPFFEKVRDSLRVGGVHLIGDVRADSHNAHFLDDFCGQHNGLGHHGYFLPDSSLAFPPLPAGLELERYDLLRYPWTSDSLKSMLEFCRGLFGLRNISDDDLKEGLKHHLNLRWDESSCSLDWEMVYLRIRRTS